MKFEILSLTNKRRFHDLSRYKRYRYRKSYFRNMWKMGVPSKTTILRPRTPSTYYCVFCLKVLSHDKRKENEKNEQFHTGLSFSTLIVVSCSLLTLTINPSVSLFRTPELLHLPVKQGDDSLFLITKGNLFSLEILYTF